MSKRIYIVHHSIHGAREQITEERRLVEAENQAQAIKHVVKGTMTCGVATPAELIALTKVGVEVEKAE